MVRNLECRNDAWVGPVVVASDQRSCCDRRENRLDSHPSHADAPYWAELVEAR